MKLHLIQNRSGFESVRLPDHPAGEYVYRIGAYVMSKEKAQRLKGALLCLHEIKKDPSGFGGSIVEIETDQPREGAIQSGVAFTYVFDAKAKNVVVADVTCWTRSDWYIDESD